MIAKSERLDPTRTLTLRKRFQTELRKRFVKLKGLIIRLVVDEDAFGLKGRNTPSVFNRRWSFETDSQKTIDFLDWLRTQIDAELLPANPTNQDYWSAFIQQGYERGAGRAFDQVRKPFAESGSVSDFYNGTRQEFLRSAFASPASQDKLRQLTNRTYLDLVNTTQAMATQTGRALADGLARGENPWTIARELNKIVDKGFNNSLRIARTEIIRAHAEGSLDAMENLGVEEVGVAVEWSTAGDDRVCPRCAPMEGVVLKIKEARGLIPLHPNCRCSLIPANVGESTRGQIRSKAGIEKAIDQSVRAEIPKKGDRTLAQRKALSRWAGAERTIAKSRPQSILSPVAEPKEPDTIKGWANLIKDKGIAESVSLSGIDDVSVAKGIHDKLDELSQKYKKTQIDRLSPKKPTGGNALAWVQTQLRISRATGKVIEKKVNYHVNKAAFQSRQTYKETVARYRDGFLASTDMDHVLTHEYGHALDAWHGDDVLKMELYRKHRADLSSVSIYAQYDEDEAIAELFAIWDVGGDDALKNIKGKDFSDYAKYFREKFTGE